jgi:hypothetical protein
VGKDRSGQDVEEQDADEDKREHEEVQGAGEEDGQDEVEEDWEKDNEDEVERAKAVEGEEEGEEEAGDKVQKHRETGGKDSAEKDEQEGENADDERAGEEKGNHDEVREDREAMEQRVTANNRDGAWESWKVGGRNDKEENKRSVESGEKERMAGEEDRTLKEGRKRPQKSEAFGCSTPKGRPNKRSKSGDSESEDVAATDDLPERTVNLEIIPRSRTSSPTSTTASPGSVLDIVRQTSVVRGLEDTVSAVRDAAQRDNVIRSLPSEQQTKMIRTALSLGSEEGIEELRRFVFNVCKDSMRGSENMDSGFDLIATHPDFTVRHANNALVPRDSDIAHFSTLYRQPDILDGKTTLFSIAKRAKLAAMAQYRKSILPGDAGKKQARSATLRLFRAVWLHHHKTEKPKDKATNPAAYTDWISCATG